MLVNMSNILKDALGRTIEINDIIVCVGQGAKWGVVLDIVKKITPYRINGRHHPEKCLVITEQFKINSLKDSVNFEKGNIGSYNLPEILNHLEEH